MFDIAPTELLLVAFIALVVIGPKDLPKAMRFVGYWVGRARGVARQFRSGFDTMVREAELEEMEKKWTSENERIMREHPAEPADSDKLIEAAAPVEPDQPDSDPDQPDLPLMVEKPVVVPSPKEAAAPTDADKAAS